MINLTFTSTCLYTSYYIITVNQDFSEVFPLQSEYAPRSLISGNLRTQYVGLSLSRDRISNSDLGSSIKRFTYTLSQYYRYIRNQRTRVTKQTRKKNIKELCFLCEPLSSQPFAERVSVPCAEQASVIGQFRFFPRSLFLTN